MVHDNKYNNNITSDKQQQLQLQLQQPAPHFNLMFKHKNNDKLYYCNILLSI